MQYFHRVFFVVLVFLLVGCANSQEPQNLGFVVTPEPEGQPDFLDNSASYPGPGDAGYPAPSVPSTSDSGYPAPVSRHSVDGRAQTALQSYALVYPVALDEFHPDAYLAAIAPSRIMLTNLGNPPVLPGWFFKFRKPDSRREFIIHVVDDIITGTTLTESAMDIGPKELPIDLAQVALDSNSVLDQFSEIGSERGIWSETASYDLELAYLEGTNGPVWSVVDSSTREWLFSIDAATGEEVENPHQQ
jgi:hypothetical protein